MVYMCSVLMALFYVLFSHVFGCGEGEMKGLFIRSERIELGHLFLSHV